MERDDIIRCYFQMGFGYNEILALLALNHGVVMSMRHFQRTLRNLRLFRRKHHSEINEVISFIRSQVQKSGRLHGYRWMHLKCIQAGLVIDRESVRWLLKSIDPAGVEQRKHSRLCRRKY